MPSDRSVPRLPGDGRETSIWIDDRPVLSLVPATGRVRVFMVWHPLRRRTDLSGHPGAVVTTLESHAQGSPTSRSEIEARTRDALHDAADRAGAWRAAPASDLLVELGGAALPMLGASYDAGATAVRWVPAWAEPVLAQTDARSAARVAFGDRVTRPVIRGLAACLSPRTTPVPSFGLLALAKIGAPVLSPDALARLLTAPRADHPTDDLPDPATMAHVGRVARWWGARRTERLLLDAAQRADGLDLLVRTARYQQDLSPQIPARLPADLDALHDLLRSRTATLATAPPEPPAPRAAAARAADLHPHRIYGPPAAHQPVTAGTPVAVPPRIRELDGTSVGDLEWTVPRTVGDLTRWGRVLSNCIGDFGSAAAAGSSTIIGLTHRHQLRYALEVTPDHRIRQFVGPANRPVEPEVRHAATSALLDAGIITPAGARGG